MVGHRWEGPPDASEVGRWPAFDTWYCAEIQLTSATLGHGEIWLNGISRGSVDADLSATSSQQYSRLMLWNNAGVGTVFMDDIRVAGALNGPVGAGGGP